MKKEIVYDSIELDEGLLDKLKSKLSRKPKETKAYDEDFGTDYQPPGFKQYHPRVQKILIYLDNDVTPDGKKTKSGEQTLFVKRGDTLHRVYGAFSLSPSDEVDQAQDEAKQVLKSFIQRGILHKNVANKLYVNINKPSKERRNIIFFSQRRYVLKENRYGKPVKEAITFRILTDAQLESLEMPNLINKMDKVIPLEQADKQKQAQQPTQQPNANQQKIDNYFNLLLQYSYLRVPQQEDKNKLTYHIGILKDNKLTKAVTIYNVLASKPERDFIPDLINAIWNDKTTQTFPFNNEPLTKEQLNSLVSFKNYADKDQLKKFFERVVEDKELKESLLKRWKLLANIK